MHMNDDSFKHLSVTTKASVTVFRAFVLPYRTTKISKCGEKKGDLEKMVLKMAIQQKRHARACLSGCGTLFLPPVSGYVRKYRSPLLSQLNPEPRRWKR